MADFIGRLDSRPVSDSRIIAVERGSEQGWPEGTRYAPRWPQAGYRNFSTVGVGFGGSLCPGTFGYEAGFRRRRFGVV